MNSLYNTPTLYCLLLEQAISLPVNKILAVTASRVRVSDEQDTYLQKKE
jgi:hypothetical protein